MNVATKNLHEVLPFGFVAVIWNVPSLPFIEAGRALKSSVPVVAPVMLVNDFAVMD